LLKIFFLVELGLDQIKINYNKEGSRHELDVNVIDVLERSGISYLSPAGFINTYFRFEPVWIHRYLIEK